MIKKCFEVDVMLHFPNAQEYIEQYVFSIQREEMYQNILNSTKKEDIHENIREFLIGEFVLISASARFPRSLTLNDLKNAKLKAHEAEIVSGGKRINVPLSLVLAAKKFEKYIRCTIVKGKSVFVFTSEQANQHDYVKNICASNWIDFISKSHLSVKIEEMEKYRNNCDEEAMDCLLKNFYV